LAARPPELVALAALVAAARVRADSAARALAGAVRAQHDRGGRGARAAAPAALGPRHFAVRAPPPALAHADAARAAARGIARTRAERALCRVRATGLGGRRGALADDRPSERSAAVRARPLRGARDSEPDRMERVELRVRRRGDPRGPATAV